jgi:SAM-dependent methyltransferase
MNFIRRIRRKLSQTLGRRRCNLCGWRGWEFGSDSWHPHTICPKCQSQVRHRLMIACYLLLPEWSFDRLFKGRRVLHFAPERQVRRLVERLASQYVTADFLDPACDLRLNMSRMDALGENSFDAVIACDVLEHVPDDLEAMRELQRILSPGGVAVLTVPQADDLTVKVELPPHASAAERLRLAGQEDHQRIYGEDFARLLQQIGFHVTSVDESSFPASFVKRHCLRPPVLSTHPLATNHRKVFFARKTRRSK